MTTAFIVLAVAFIALIVMFIILINGRDETPHITIQPGGVVNNDAQPANIITGLPEFKVVELGFGRSGQFMFDGTYFSADNYEGKLLFAGVKVNDLYGKANVVGPTGNRIPQVQFSFVDPLTTQTEIAEVTNADRQTMQFCPIAKGDIFYLTCPILEQGLGEKFYTLTLRYRIDNGEGWGNWLNADAINIHKLK